MMISLILCVIVVLLFIVWRVSWDTYIKMVNQFPGPKPLSFPIGNIFEWGNDPGAIFKMLRRYSDEFKSSYALWACWFPAINILTPEDTEILLSSPKHIRKGHAYIFLRKWLGTGLLLSKGTKWHTRRKVLTPAFHFSILRKFVEIFGEHSDKLISELREECRKDKTDIVPLIAKCAINIICETAMGTSLNAEEETVGSSYRKAIHDYSNVLLYRLMRPWLYFDSLFKLCPAGWKEPKYLNLLHTFTNNVIEERERNFKESDVENLENDDECFKSRKRLAMLDLLIDAKRKGEIDGPGVREEVDTFMFEGHDTVAAALCFCLMVLANHRDVQDKIFQECSSIFGDSKRPAKYEDLHNMKYLEMCLKESMRLYPSVPFISRYITEDLKLTHGTVPARTEVNVHIFDLHRNPNIYPDPDKFDPDRFLPENVQKRHPYSYIPFSAGPRNCIGQKYAMLELKSIVSGIMRNYILEPVDAPTDLKLVVALVLRNKTGIYVRFVER